jgi:hypothetical protein
MYAPRRRLYAGETQPSGDATTIIAAPTITAARDNARRDHSA